MSNEQVIIYTSRQGKKHRIDKMSIGYLRTQITYIIRTGINYEYLTALQKAYNKRTQPIFKPLLDEYRE
jgi:hypothetical protein